MARTTITQLTRLRITRGFTQVRLAERSGIAEHTIYRVESGKIHPQFHTIRRLAEALGVSPIHYFELVYETWLEQQPLDGETCPAPLSRRSDSVAGTCSSSINEFALD